MICLQEGKDASELGIFCSGTKIAKQSRTEQQLVEFIRDNYKLPVGKIKESVTNI